MGEIEFFSSIAEIHSASVLSSFKNGQRAKLSQTAVGRWKNGQIVNERFYYNKG